MAHEATRICKYCGREFTSENLQQAYCGKSCRTHNFLFKRYGVVHCVECGQKDVILRHSKIRICDYCKSKKERTLEKMSAEEQLHYGKVQAKKYAERMWKTTL